MQCLAADPLLHDDPTNTPYLDEFPIFHPLGGCGEIGMNLSLYGYENDWIAVDCGMMIRQDLPDQPLQIPNFGVLVQDPRTTIAST